MGAEPDLLYRFRIGSVGATPSSRVHYGPKKIYRVASAHRIDRLAEKLEVEVRSGGAVNVQVHSIDANRP